MLVEEVMVTDVVTCEADASLRSVAERMFNNRVGSVLVYDDGRPAGIVTETDLVHAGYETGRSFSEIAASSAMSRPIVTIPGDRTLRKAADRMERKGVKKLVVSEDLDVVGIVTLTDVAFHLSDIKREIHEIHKQSYRERKS